MERFRLKNIIILILAAVNLFLLASLLIRNSEEQTARQRTVQELTGLFAADGIQLADGVVSTDVPPSAKSLNRDIGEDRTIAAFFLGDDFVSADEGGGIYVYQSGALEGQFRSTGSFDLTGPLAEDEMEGVCRQFCKTFGYQDLVLPTTESGLGTAVQYYDGYPVYNCTVTFLVENGRLTSASGSHIPQLRPAATDVYNMTAATALMTFLNFRRESGAVVSQVQDVFPCYELQSTTAYPIVLLPAWAIQTDTANYYVNCATGTVTRG